MMVVNFSATLTLLLFNFLISAKTQTNYTNKVQTDSGVVVGQYLNTVLKSVPYIAFKGIPYAEPPIQELRFKPPVPKRPWNGTLLTTTDGKSCMQIKDDIVIGSENCLFLNVYTPMLPGNQSKPVVAWLHGGAFTTGNASSGYYGPDFLLEKDVIVVTIQYRLGPFGFLNINHPNASGNCGLKDQNLALRWIKKNIQQFQGDPQRVTLFGQSSGGVCVDLHMLSDMSSGLFSQSISMSGSPLCNYWAFQSNVEAEGQAFLLAANLGLKSNNKDDFLLELYKTPGERIIEEAHNLPMIPFRPTIERADIASDQPKFLSECTPKKYKEGRYNKMPHLMGFNQHEILTLVKTFDDLVTFHIGASRYLKKHTPLGLLPVVPNLVTLALNTTAALKKMALSRLINELSDMYFVTGIDKKQKLLSEHNSHSIYYYRFAFKSSYSAHKVEGIDVFDGIGHEDELPYLFYRPHINLPLNDPAIKATRERLVTMWTNFIKYGNPTPHGEEDPLLGVTWPDSGRNDGTHLEIDDSLTVKDRPTNIFIKFYQLIGLGDSSVFNDCSNNFVSNIVNGIANIPGAITQVLKHPTSVLKVIPKVFG